jgi:ATP-dependent helicase/nuclease subunit B
VRSPGTTLLVPTERHLDAELPHRGGSVRGRVFRDFVTSTAVRVAPEVNPATPHVTRLLTREALALLPLERLHFPEEPAARVALAHAVDRAVGRLRRAGTTPHHLRVAGTPQALLLADIVAHADDRLAAARLYDARGAAGIAAERVSRGADPGDLGGAITVSGMAAWEPDDLALLEALHARLRAEGAAGLTLELPGFAGPIARAEGDAIAPVADELERRWASLADAPEIAFGPARSGAPAGVIAARTADGEARAVVADVVGALERGTPPERVAIVLPDLDETRLEPFRAALGDARIPFAEPRGRPVASCPEGRIALALLAVAAGPVTRDTLIELLRAPGLHPGAWTDRSGAQLAVGRAVMLAHRLREVPVEIDRTGRLFVDALADATRSRPEEGWMPRALDRMLKETHWIGAEAAGMATRREIARRLISLADRLELGRPPVRELGAALHREGRGRAGGRASSKTAEAGPSALALRALGDSAAAVRALREALRAIIEGADLAGLGDEPVSAAELGAELGVAVAELGIGLGTAGGGAVRLGRPADLAGLLHDRVFVTGLGERAYSGAEADLALLDELTRRKLPAGCRPPSSREREAWRRAELCWAMAGSDRVTLSYALGDDDLLSPHRLVRWAAEHGAETRHEPASRLSRGASTSDPRGAELQALAAGVPPRGDIAARVAVERARLAFFLDPRAPADTHTGKVDLAGAAARASLVAAVGGDTPERPVAVTAIERAAGCAFAGFARRVLRVRRVDDLAESADHRERGTLVHRALHAAFEGMRGAADPAQALALAQAAAERELRLSGNMAPLRREAVLSAVADAMGVVERSLESGDGLRFLAAEQSFGSIPRGAEPGFKPWDPLPIGGDDGGPVLYVDGQIDRIDLSADGRRARVVDYKTGRLPAADDHGRSTFQLPLYAAVVARRLELSHVEVLYVSVRPRGVIEEWPRNEDERQALGGRRDEIAQAARKVILRLWEGEVAPRPAKATLCTRCEARDICRRPAVAPIEEAEG